MVLAKWGLLNPIESSKGDSLCRDLPLQGTPFTGGSLFQGTPYGYCDRLITIVVNQFSFGPSPSQDSEKRRLNQHEDLPCFFTAYGNGKACGACLCDKDVPQILELKG